MILKLPVTTAFAAKRATAPRVTGGLKPQCRASHSSALQDSAQSPSSASQEHSKDETVRKVSGQEASRSSAWKDFTEVHFTEVPRQKENVPKRKKIGGKTPNGQNPRKGTLAFVKKIGHVPIRRLGSPPPQNQKHPYRLTPIDSEAVTDAEFTKKWTTKLNRNHPALVRRMPGFLESQSWFQHPDAFRSGEFTSRASPLGAKFRIDRSNVTTDAWINPNRRLPLEKFQRWLMNSGRSNRHNLDRTVDRLLKLAKVESDPWLSFEAPIAFIREVIQYNKELGPDNAIRGLAGLIELEDRLTEDFPYPPIVRKIGGLTYNANSCSIRLGIEPRRSDLKRSTATTVIGQLAGYGQQFAGKDRQYRINRWPVHKNIMKATWVLGFEQTIPERINAELKPGDALLIPPGWWYGIRNTNWHNQLNATVGWYLNTDESPYNQDRDHDAKAEDAAEIGDDDFTSEFGRVPLTGMNVHSKP
ncbi:Transcription factor jumonji/aspartyl beta-hydroxylase [Apiospora kogelbergensis]|uniref:Transcription factor jumonji/aspartyl beta-hydroxylase n=1 Tax=Apiospora kogelbergensis TaxID=1337665 RepID=UPI00312D323D